jgi:peptide/nickel transport system substrate-binding protein
VTVALVFLTALSACTPEAEPETQVVEQTVVVEVEKEVTRVVEGTPIVETVVETVVEVVTATPEPAPPEEPQQRVLVVAQGADPTTLDAGMTTGTVMANVIHNIYDTLVIRDDDMSVIPGLALSWEPLDDTTWRFALREGVKFHNGEDFNADAVKFSIERVIDPDQAAPQASYLSTIASVEVVDDYTVDIITSAPDPILIARLTKAVGSIMPPGYVQEVGDETVALEPVGTGPFKFVEWVKDDHLTLEVNPDYWRDLPEYDVLTFKPIPNAAARTAALLAGDVDLVYNVPVSQIDVVQESTDAQLAAVDIQAGEYVGFNLRKEDSPLQDVRVRQAINYAIDVDSIIEGVLNGNATRRASPVTPLDFGYVALEPYAYDPEMAQQLLAEAGYATGLSLHYDTCNGRYPMDKQVSEVVASMLEAVGIEVELQVHEWGAYLDLFKNDQLGDLYLLGWGSISTLDADAALYDELHCGKTYSTHCSPELDALMDEARSVIDSDTRMDLYEQIQRMILEDPPWVFMYQEKQFYGLSDKVTWGPRADSLLNLYRVAVAP